MSHQFSWHCCLRGAGVVQPLDVAGLCRDEEEHEQRKKRAQRRRGVIAKEDPRQCRPGRGLVVEGGEQDMGDEDTVVAY